VESSILKICEELEGAFPKIILEGNILIQKSQRLMK
jgi:hypothetical protein